ncbi:MAG: glycosyltransferase family 39 protein [Armatimonadetes bacterium]|nr:glycosyltransferase family 39 protein [Armatimonadota bacterium]
MATDRPTTSRFAGRAPWVILGVAFLVRLIVVVAALRDPSIPPSTDNYVGMAELWLEEGYYSKVEWPPVYPFLAKLLLLSVGKGPIFHILLALHLLCGTASVWFVWRIASLLGLEPRACVLGAAIAALEPSAVIHTGLVLTETLYVFVLTGSLFALLRSFDAERAASIRRGLLGGVGMALGSLLRFVGLPVAVAMGVWTALTGPVSHRRRRLISCALLLVPVALANIAWATRNYVDLGHFEIHSSGGHNLAVMWVGPARVMHERLPVDSRNCLYVWTPEELGEHWDTPDKFAQSRAMARAAVKWALAHPLEIVAGLVRSAALLWFGPGRAPWEKITGLDPLPLWLNGMLYLFHFVFAILTAIGLWCWWNGRREARAGLALVFLMIAVHQLSLGCSGYNRYLVPIVPFASMLAAVALIDVSRYLRNSLAHMKQSGWLEPEVRPRKERVSRADAQTEDADFGLRNLLTDLGKPEDTEEPDEEGATADDATRKE